MDSRVGWRSIHRSSSRVTQPEWRVNRTSQERQQSGECGLSGGQQPGQGGAGGGIAVLLSTGGGIAVLLSTGGAIAVLLSMEELLQFCSVLEELFQFCSVLEEVHPSQMSYPVQKSCNGHFLSYCRPVHYGFF